MSSSSSASKSSASSSSSSFLASSSAFFLSSSSWASFIFFSASLVTAHRSSPAFLASAGSSVIMMLSKMVPDLTCHKSKPILQFSSYLPRVLASSSSYSGLSICLGFHSPLYSGLSIIGGSHSPSISSSQSSGLVASGSAICSGFSQSSGLESSGSSILALSTQSAGFFASGSLIFFGGRKSQSSVKVPDSAFSLSIRTSKEPSVLRMRVYKWVNTSSLHLISFLIRWFFPLCSKMTWTFLVPGPQISGPNITL